MSQSSRILKLIKESGNRGIENYRLANTSLKYSCRIAELRAEGHNIYAERQYVNGRWTGVWKYYLNSEDLPIIEKRPSTVKQARIDELLAAKSRGRVGIYKYVCGRLEKLLKNE